MEVGASQAPADSERYLMPSRDPDASGQPTDLPALSGGHLLAKISTSIVAIMREHYGRGPMRAKTYVLDDIIVCVLRGSGFTPLEQTMMDDDGADRVVAI